MTTNDYFAIVAAVIVVAAIAFGVFNTTRGVKTAIATVRDPSQRPTWKFYFTLIGLVIGLGAMFIFGG